MRECAVLHQASMKSMTQQRRWPSAEPRAWQRMLSGRRLDLLNPSPADIEIEDIAHGLARVARWNGQTTGAHAFSVAQHALVVEDIAVARKPDWPARWRLPACCTTRPNTSSATSSARSRQPSASTTKPLSCVYLPRSIRRFGIASQVCRAMFRREIKAADRIAAYFEATRLAGFGEDEATALFRAARRVNGRHRRGAAGP